MLLWICRALLEIYTGSAAKCIFERGLLAGIEIGLFCGYVGLFCGYVGLFCGYIPVALENAIFARGVLGYIIDFVQSREFLIGQCCHHVIELERLGK